MSSSIPKLFYTSIYVPGYIAAIPQMMNKLRFIKIDKSPPHFLTYSSILLCILYWMCIFSTTLYTEGMTGRFSRRIAQVHDIAQSIIDNHPLSEIVDGNAFCSETLDSGSDIAANRIDNSPLSWAAKREKHVSAKLNTSHASIIFSECISTGGTGRTLSTDSWCDDDFEKENTKKVRNILDSVDEMIYESKMLDGLSPEVQDECQLWARKFPCLRILGKQILHSEADGIHLPMIKLKDRSKSNEITSFYTKDAPFPVLPLREVESEPNHFASNNPFDHEYEDNAYPSTNSTEETIAQDGQYEEFFACHNFNNYEDEDISEDNSSLQKTPLSDLNVDAIRECIIDKLMESLWPEMLLLWHLIKDEGNGDEKAVSTHKKTLPSLSIPSKSSDVKRNWEYGGSHHPLDGILTISSKVLQKRDHRFSAESGIVTRPGSSLTSPHRTVSFQSSMSSVQEPPFFRNSLQQGGSNFPSVPNSRVSSAVRRLNRYVSRDVEWCEALQCLQEESENLSNVEHSHIQQPLCDVDETADLRFPTSHFSLPPIIDANSISTKQNIKSPISPISVENPLLDKRLNNRLARNEEIDSRPSTCISTRSVMGQNNKNFKNPEFPCTYDSPDFQILGGLSSKLLSPSTQKEGRSQLPHLGPKLTSERLVTLFPIIKSLELQKQNDNKKTLTKRNQSAKRLGHYNTLNQSKR